MHDSTVTSVDFQLVVQSLFKLPATFFFFFSFFEFIDNSLPRWTGLCFEGHHRDE